MTRWAEKPVGSNKFTKNSPSKVRVSSTIEEARDIEIVRSFEFKTRDRPVCGVIVQQTGL